LYLRARCCSLEASRAAALCGTRGDPLLNFEVLQASGAVKLMGVQQLASPVLYFMYLWQQCIKQQLALPRFSLSIPRLYTIDMDGSMWCGHLSCCRSCQHGCCLMPAVPILIAANTTHIGLDVVWHTKLARGCACKGCTCIALWTASKRLKKRCQRLPQLL
jgi:hypothetical protein